MTVVGTTFDLVVAANRLPVDRVVDADGVRGWQPPGIGFEEKSKLIDLIRSLFP